ncbi:MAG: DUF4372 domain-containing protein [Ignavibacteria bacterium]|nr:DUF4372 domain-containing protein [Ignavibacteria bacterium]
MTLFSQIINKLNRQTFNKLVSKFSIGKHVKGIKDRSQLLIILYFQRIIKGMILYHGKNVQNIQY